MCLLNLMIKVSYNESKKFSNNQINLLNLTQTDLHLQAIQSLSVQKKRDSPFTDFSILLLPGTHDLLAAIETVELKTVETLVSLFKTNIINSILKWNQSKNSLNLKTVRSFLNEYICN